MRFTEADLFKFAAAFGPLFAVLGLMGLTGTAADGIAACIGAAAMSWVLTEVASVLVGPPISVSLNDEGFIEGSTDSVTWKDISEEEDGR